MKQVYMIEYGILCSANDERKIVRGINDFMAKEYEYRKMYRTNNESFLKARLPFIYDHYYYQFLKQSPPWYFELYPNTDLQGRMKFATHPEVGWVLFTKKQRQTPTSPIPESDYNFITEFFDGLCLATGFDTIMLHEYEENEERL